jgi:hypothetical protein
MVAHVVLLSLNMKAHQQQRKQKMNRMDQHTLVAKLPLILLVISQTLPLVVKTVIILKVTLFLLAT